MRALAHMASVATSSQARCLIRRDRTAIRQAGSTPGFPAVHLVHVARGAAMDDADPLPGQGKSDQVSEEVGLLGQPLTGSSVSSLFDMLNSLAPPPRLPTAFEYQKLASFARKRGLSIGVPGWEDEVLFQAAAEHPELKSFKRGRGRPRRTGVVLGLLADRRTDADRKAEHVLYVAEMYCELQKAYGRKASDAAACRFYVQYVERSDPVRDTNFDKKVRVRQNQLIKARKARDARTAKSSL